MPVEKPSGLPENPPDPRLFAVPVNDPPRIAWPDPVPEDPSREVVVSEGATHVVIANAFGEFVRGDKISAHDLPEAADMEALAKIKPYPPIRPLSRDVENDERPKANEITRHRKAKAPVAPPLVPPATGTATVKPA